MADLSIKNLPEALYRRLKRSAKRNQRSLNREIIYRIDLGLQSPPERTPAEVRAILRSAGRLRRMMRRDGVWIESEEIQEAREQGRP